MQRALTNDLCQRLEGIVVAWTSQILRGNEPDVVLPKERVAKDDLCETTVGSAVAFESIVERV